MKTTDENPLARQQRELNRQPKYPPTLGMEVEEVAAQVCFALNQRAAKFANSEFPYVAQFMLEELIKRLQERV